MTLSDQQIRALVYLAKDCRPTGARQWSEDKLYAEIAKLRGRSLGAVILAVTRAAMDRNAQRPEVISSAGSHWSDTMLAQDYIPDSIPRESRCAVCGKSEPSCQLANSVGHPDSHEFESLADARRRFEEADHSALKGAIAALKDELAHTDPRDPAPTLADREKNPAVKAAVDRLRAANPGLETPPMQEQETTA